MDDAGIRSIWHPFYGVIFSTTFFSYVVPRILSLTVRGV
jgi:hypothetical protein